ncbi:MAG: sulfotransferase [Xanthomonadales bacterium]|nr:sulfotransferase [Xanthomonadales bacterium]
MSAETATAPLQQALAHAERLLQRDPGLAAEQLSEILRAVPNHPPALLLLGEAKWRLGQREEARQEMLSLARAQPNWALAQHSAARMLIASGAFAEALPLLRRAAELRGDLPGVWRDLADLHDRLGQREAAAQCYLRHTRHAAQEPALLAAGSALAENRIPDAEARLRRHLQQAPTDVAALRMLAEVAARIGRYEDAETLLLRCVDLAPGFLEARQNLVQVLHRSNEPERALIEVETLLAIDPAHPGFRNLKAVLLCRTGDYASALDLYAGILAELPGESRIWLSYGHALKTAGDTARAIDAYRRCIAIEPRFGEAWWSLANLKTYRFTEDDLATMRRELDDPALDAEHRLHFDFALGKALEDAADYPTSFAHYAAGNALRKQRVPYRADDTQQRVERARVLFDRAFFEARQGWGDASADPIFVVGLPRAGSTLVEQILASHPAVEGTMELPEIISLARGLRAEGDADADLPYYDALTRIDAQACAELGARYVARTRIQRKTDAPHFVDKMPNNFAHLALIHLALPHARVIDVRRHPMACCFSGFKQHFARGQNFSYDLDDIGRYYRDYVELMAHYDAVLPGRVHRVIYEELIDDTEAEVRRLLAYCGLPFDPACLKFYENARPVRTASSEQVRQPIHRGGLDQWQHYAAWLDPLRTALGPVLDSYPQPHEIVAGGTGVTVPSNERGHHHA